MNSDDCKRCDGLGYVLWGNMGDRSISREPCHDCAERARVQAREHEDRMLSYRLTSFSTDGRAFPVPRRGR